MHGVAIATQIASLLSAAVGREDTDKTRASPSSWVWNPSRTFLAGVWSLIASSSQTSVQEFFLNLAKSLAEM